MFKIHPVSGPPRHPALIAALVAGVVATGTAGNALLRVGLHSSPVASPSPAAYFMEFANLAVILGVVLLIARYLFQLSLLSWADLTYVLPVTSVSYVVVTLVGVFILHEHVSRTHWWGVLLIFAGAVVVGRTPPLTTVGEKT